MDHVTIWALEKINSEWIAAKNLATQPITEGPCDCDIYIKYGLPCTHYLLRACIQGFPISISLFHPRWRLNGPSIASGNWQARYYDDFINPDDANSTKYHDVDKNRFLHAAVSLQKLHQELSRQQIDLLVNQLSIFHVNVTVTHEKLQKMSQRLSVMLSKSPSTKKEVWTELRQKKKHDRVNARALTAAKAAERDAKRKEVNKRRTVRLLSKGINKRRTVRLRTVRLQPHCHRTPLHPSLHPPSLWRSSFEVDRKVVKTSHRLLLLLLLQLSTNLHSLPSHLWWLEQLNLAVQWRKQLYESRSPSLDVAPVVLRWR